MTEALCLTTQGKARNPNRRQSSPDRCSDKPETRADGRGAAGTFIRPVNNPGVMP